MHINDIDITPIDLLNSGKFDYIVRHHKIIKRNNYNSKVDEERRSTADNKHIEYTYVYNDYLSQDIDNYLNYYLVDLILLKNPYKDNNLMSECYHNKMILFGNHYNTISELKNNITNKQIEVKQLYINDVINDNFTEEEINNLEELIRKFNEKEITHLYIRMAPGKDMKNELLERLYNLQNIEIPEDFNDHLVYEDDGIPVYNDQIIYSNNKYEKINELVNE